MQSLYVFRGPPTKGIHLLRYARRCADQLGGHFRAPHHTINATGALSELAISAGGVLWLDDPQEFRPEILTSLRRTLAAMSHPPIVFLRITSPLSALQIERIERGFPTFTQVDAPDHPETICTVCGDLCPEIVCCDSGYREADGYAIHSAAICRDCCTCPTARTFQTERRQP